MAESELIELTDFNRDIADDQYFRETEIDLPDVPLEIQDTDTLHGDLKIVNFVDSIRKDLNLTRDLNKDVYKKISVDNEGYFHYNNKRLSFKRGSKSNLYSIKTLLKNVDGREFLHMIGYEDRNMDTVSPEQTQVIKTKITSFKATQEWANKEKEKANRQLKLETDETRRKELEDSVVYYDQMEIQAKRRYSELVENQLKRINSVINDKSKSLSERLKELFKRDGLTIGAIITAIGMSISTIVLSIIPRSGNSGGPTPNQPTNQNFIKKTLIKIANWFLDLAKKALSTLPGVIGSLASFLFKKAGEAVLFLSEHIIILIVAVLFGIAELFIMKVNKKS